MERPKAALASRFRSDRMALPGHLGLSLALLVPLLAFQQMGRAAEPVRPAPEEAWAGTSASWDEPAPRPKVSPVRLIVPAQPKAKRGGSSYLFFSPKKRSASPPAADKPKPGKPAIAPRAAAADPKNGAVTPKSLSYLFFQPQKGFTAGPPQAGPRGIPSAAMPKAKPKPPIRLGEKSLDRPLSTYQPYLIFQPKGKILSSSKPKGKTTTQ